MSTLVENLVKLGLKEYEAKIYIALSGVGEANARTVHEMSGVPRPRVYDILGELTSKGFVEIRQGSPLFYRSVPPDVVISELQRELNQAAKESITALESLSLKSVNQYVPLWHVKGDRSVNRHLKMLITRAEEELSIFVNDESVMERYAPLISETIRCPIKILIKPGTENSIIHVSGASYYEIDILNPFFRKYILDRIFTEPVTRDDSIYVFEWMILSKDREMMVIYTINEERMAMITSFPFTLYAQTMAFAHMVKGAKKVELNGEKG